MAFTAWPSVRLRSSCWVDDMKSIAVIRLGRLGDVVLTGPTVKNLRFLYPDARVVYVTRGRYAPLAQMLAGVDEVLTFPDDGSYFDLMRLSNELDRQSPDLAVDLHKNFRSFHLASMTKAEYKVVYHKRRQERLAAVNDKKFVTPVPHTVDLYNRVIDNLHGEKLARRPDLMLPVTVLRAGSPARNAVAFAPGASSPVKMWSTARFAELAERIHYDFKLPLHVFLGKGEERLQTCFDDWPPQAITIHYNAPLPEIAALLSTCRLTVTNDSGLMHISSAVGTPTAAVFGPTHEQLGFSPLGIHDRVFETDETCRPCSLHGNKPCYREEQYCFTRLTVDQIYPHIAAMLERITLPPAVFIDRDGTLIEDRHYLADPGQIAFIPGSLKAIARLKQAGYKVVIISNQSGVARGFFGIETINLIHHRLKTLMAEAGAPPDDIRFCPHYPDGDVPEYSCDCLCRKPKPGMVEDAAGQLGLDLKRSFLIGDKFTDIQCARIAGMGAILVRTGEGRASEERLPAPAFLRPDTIGDDLAAAVDHILSRG